MRRRDWPVIITSQSSRLLLHNVLSKTFRDVTKAGLCDVKERAVSRDDCRKAYYFVFQKIK